MTSSSMPQQTLSSLLCTRTSLVQSRPEACDLIAAGRVTLHGTVLDMDSEPVLPTQLQSVQVDGEPLVLDPLRYVVLNKPRGVLTARKHDPTFTGTEKQTVMDVLHHGGLSHPESLFAVGRLDEESEGLLLLTNDGVLCHHLTDPTAGVEKRYLAVARGKALGRNEWHRLDDGICSTVCEEGLEIGLQKGAASHRVFPTSMRMMEYEEANHKMGGGLSECIQDLLHGAHSEELSGAHAEGLEEAQLSCEAGLKFIEIVLTEGKKHEVRRLLKALHCHTLRLVRLQHGLVVDSEVLRRPGSHRNLTTEEVDALRVSLSGLG